MPYLACLDIAHGMDTVGKETPILSNGKRIKEHTISKAIVLLLSPILERCGIDVLITGLTDKDEPLISRTNRINTMYKDYQNKFGKENVKCTVLSVHANALTGTFQTKAEGIVSFYQENALEDKKFVEVIHKQLIQGTKMYDYGVRSNNLHMTRESKPVAGLFEVGFMDNLKDVALLLSEAYQDECAVEIAKGVCEYFGISYIQEKLSNRERAAQIIKTYMSEPDKWLPMLDTIPNFVEFILKIKGEL